MAAIALVLLGVVVLQWKARATASDRLPASTIAESRPRDLTGWDLRDAHGATFDERALLGRWSVVLIGYTSCPDVCPATLASLAGVVDDLEAQVVFVAVDPARDERGLEAYVRFFQPRIRGVTGDPDALAMAVAQLGGAYELREDGLVEHSPSLFVIDPHARVVGHLLRPTSQHEVRAGLASLKQRFPPRLTGELWIPPRPGAMGVVYGSLRNPGPSSVTLSGLTSADYQDVSLHETVVRDGLSIMRPAAPIHLRAGETLTLEPGGHHVMVSGQARDGETAVMAWDLGNDARIRVAAKRR